VAPSLGIRSARPVRGSYSRLRASRIRKKTFSIASACIGSGQGIAMLIKRWE
jgi:hypothetical protein